MCGPQVAGALGGKSQDPNNPFKPVSQGPQLQGLPDLAAVMAHPPGRPTQMTAAQPRMVQ